MAADAGAEPAVVAAEPRVTFAQIQAYGSSIFAHVALIGIMVVLLAGVCARAFERLSNALPAARSIPDVAHVSLGAAVITLGCALPSVLMYCMKVLVVGSLNSRARFRLPFPARPGRGADTEEARLYDEAGRLWEHEIQQFDQRSSRLSQHVNFYGFFCTVALSVAALLVMRPLGGGGEDARSGVAVATAAAAVVAFVIDVSRMIVRAAHRDASARMFAWASRRFLLILLSTIILCSLVLVGKADSLPGGNIGWLLLGAGMAFLGDRATQTVSERLVGVLGAAPARRGAGNDLERLDGVTEEDLLRLAEEGVSSVHTLAFHATPMLFLSTPFTLAQLCDWQDQALLLVRLGKDRAALCREQLMVRGATEAQRLARDFLSNRLTPDERGDLLKVLGLSSTVQANALMVRLAQDPVAARLEIFRRALPELEGTAASGERRGGEKRMEKKTAG